MNGYLLVLHDPKTRASIFPIIYIHAYMNAVTWRVSNRPEQSRPK